MENVDKTVFYTRPTNSILLETNNKVQEVNLEDIRKLALFALSLRPNGNVSEPLEYAMALNEFFSNNENELSEAYSKLSVSHFGLVFLSTNIKLALLELLFRENGIDEKIAQVYNNELVEYNGQLALNDAMFAKEIQSVNMAM